MCVCGGGGGVPLCNAFVWPKSIHEWLKDIILSGWSLSPLDLSSTFNKLYSNINVLTIVSVILIASSVAMQGLIRCSIPNRLGHFLITRWNNKSIICADRIVFSFTPQITGDAWPTAQWSQCPPRSAGVENDKRGSCLESRWLVASASGGRRR